MRDYLPLAVAAKHLNANEDTLIDFNRTGWIGVIVKGGCQFISGQDEYRARFILDLRRKLALNDEDIGIILSNEKPPYSLNQVPSILVKCGGRRAGLAEGAAQPNLHHRNQEKPPNRDTSTDSNVATQGQTKE